MTPQLEYIDIVFENCDSVRIPSNYILGISFEKISNYLWSNMSGQLIEENVCEKFEIELKNEALGIQTRFQNEFEDKNSDDSFEKHLNIFNDITHIDIRPLDREGIYIAVPWKNNNENYYKNILQKTEFKEDTFIITCKEDADE